MSASFVTPDGNAVAKLLETIFGNGLAVSDSDSPDVSDKHTATFIDDEDKLVAVCVCDKSFVAYSGAALSMIPAGVANDMINGGEVSEALVGNFYEVMNICSKLLMSDSSAHLRLDKVLEPGDAGSTTAELKGDSVLKGFIVDIPGYGSGEVSFLIA